MRTSLRRIGLAIAATVAIASASTALPSAAQAQRWHGHGGWGHNWHGGGWGRNWAGGGWGWGPGFAFGFGAAAPFGYYGGPYAYAGACYLRPRWVVNRWGHTVRRWVRVCY